MTDRRQRPIAPTLPLFWQLWYVLLQLACCGLQTCYLHVVCCFLYCSCDRGLRGHLRSLKRCSLLFIFCSIYDCSLQRLRDVGDEHTPMLFDAPIWSDPVGILVSPETGRMELQHSLDSLTIHFSMLTNYQAWQTDNISVTAWTALCSALYIKKVGFCHLTYVIHNELHAVLWHHLAGLQKICLQ